MSNIINALYARWGKCCHYCGNETKKKRGPKNQPGALYPTRDHVVPKAFGGRDSQDNYVLSCYSCNHKRATMLFFCKCDWCNSLIQKALDSRAGLNKIFESMITFNRPRIRVIRGRYQLQVGHHRKMFETLPEAFNFALNDHLVKDVDYANDSA